MKKVLQHVLDKIKTAKIETDIPNYPYFGVTNIFPDEYYEKLIEVFGSMDGRVFSALSKNYYNRYKYDLFQGENINRKRNDFHDLSEEQEKFWTEFQNTFLI